MITAKGSGPAMCNLYSNTTNQALMRQLFRAEDMLGNYGSQVSIYPDMEAPIVRHSAAGGRELVMGRWGMPTPPKHLEGKKTDRGVTNVRNTNSPHWRRWLGPENRCLVPLSSFAEPHYQTKKNVWFRFEDERPACFAGIWTRWTSVRKLKEGEVTADLYAFLTCPPNEEVGGVHPKAMPVILADESEWDTWMNAEWSEAKQLQRPLGDRALSFSEP